MSARDYLNEAFRSPSEWLRLEDDFIQGATTVPNAHNWDVAVKDSGASSTLEADIHLGCLLMSSAATTNDDGALVQSLREFIKPTSGKRFAVEFRVKASDADQHDAFFGLAQRASTDPEATLAASNRIGFQINDGDASILLKSEASDLETSKDSEQDQADDTYVVLGLSYNGTGKISFHIDNSPVGTIESNIPATELAIAMFNLSGNNTGTHTARVDYVRACVER